MFIGTLAKLVSDRANLYLPEGEVKGVLLELGRMGYLTEDVDGLETIEETGWEDSYERAVGILADGEEVVMLLEEGETGMIAIYHHTTDSAFSGMFDMVHQSAIAPTNRRMMVEFSEYGGRYAG